MNVLKNNQVFELYMMIKKMFESGEFDQYFLNKETEKSDDYDRMAKDCSVQLGFTVVPNNIYSSMTHFGIECPKRRIKKEVVLSNKERLFALEEAVKALEKAVKGLRESQLTLTGVL